MLYDKRQLDAAYVELQKEVLPGLGKAYDATGPAAVLALVIVLTDVWTANGFTAEEWHAFVPFPDLPEWRSAGAF